MTFGLYFSGGYKAWYGARAIFTNHYVDIVWDRQQATGDKKSRDKLEKWLNSTGLPALRKKAAQIYSGSDEVHVLIDGDFFMIFSPRASHGYMYIGAIVMDKDFDPMKHSPEYLLSLQANGSIEHIGKGVKA